MQVQITRSILASYLWQSHPSPFHPQDPRTQVDRSAELNPHDPSPVLHPSRYADNPPSEPVAGKSDTPEPDTAAVVVEGSLAAYGLAGIS